MGQPPKPGPVLLMLATTAVKAEDNIGPVALITKVQPNNTNHVGKTKSYNHQIRPCVGQPDPHRYVINRIWMHGAEQLSMENLFIDNMARIILIPPPSIPRWSKAR